MPSLSVIAGPITLADRYQAIRSFTDRIARPLTNEDCMIQSMPDASPTRWHMAHSTWFFETFILAERPGYREFDPQFRYLFNSYYNSVGNQYPRAQRGLISRPGQQRTVEYRQYVDEQMLDFLSNNSISDQLEHTISVGLNHEQQHQELMLTDIKHAFFCNPLLPAYDADGQLNRGQMFDSDWVNFSGRIFEIGHDGTGFAFDNESPRHRVLLEDFSLATQPVNCREYMDFIRDGGYERPDHWLSMGWAAVQQQGWRAPLYWYEQDNQWMVYTSAGPTAVCDSWPVCHVSYFEADAFARWAGYRLPTEFEWEAGCPEQPSDQFADLLLDKNAAIHPTGQGAQENQLAQMLGGVWEWTSSSYSAYPRYTPPNGAIGEYNGKFMCNQYVSRGGSVATSQNHIRRTYRNFFPPEARWQYSGIRLAR